MGRVFVDTVGRSVRVDPPGKKRSSVELDKFWLGGHRERSRRKGCPRVSRR